MVSILLGRAGASPNPSELNSDSCAFDRKYNSLILLLNLTRAASVILSSSRPHFYIVVLSEMKTACFRMALFALQEKAGNCRGEGEKVAGTTKA